MRLKLRMKTDEAERVRNLYEDNLVVVKEYKLDIERQKQQLDLLKSEYGYKIPNLLGITKWKALLAK